MSRTKLATAMGLASIGIATFASTATAATAGWVVNGTFLSGSAALSTSANVDEATLLKSAGAGVEVKCSGKTLNSVAPEIKAPNAAAASELEFTSCASLTASCKLASEKIATVPVVAESTLQGASAVRTTFKPKTKTVFATIRFEGAECAVAGTEPVDGAIKTSLPSGQTEATTQLIEAVATEESGELKLGSSSAALKGSALLQLASCQGWKFQ